MIDLSFAKHLFLALLWICNSLPEVVGCPQDATDAAVEWRRKKIEQLDKELDSVEQNAPLHNELLAQRAWLNDWVPSEMPSTKPDRSNELMNELLLANLQRPKTIDSSAWNEIVRLQTELLESDQDDTRKENLKQTIRLAKQLEQRLVAALSVSDKRLPSPTGWVLAFTRYRLGRALAYRELPVVRERWPIENEESYEVELMEAVNRLREQTGETRPEFILLEDRMLRRAGHKGLALKMLEKNKQFIDLRWYLKKRRDLLGELGWDPAQQEAAEIYSNAGFADQ